MTETQNPQKGKEKRKQNMLLGLKRNLKNYLRHKTKKKYQKIKKTNKALIFSINKEFLHIQERIHDT